jgi:hypothetical protein
MARRRDDQHSQKTWWREKEILESDDVHEYTSAYFTENPATAVHMGKDSLRSEKQYKIISDRRNSFNTLLWQSPALSLTAQAFLLNVVSAQDRPITARIVCGATAVVVALCTFQLFAKHRYHERTASDFLAEFERNHRHLGYVPINGQKYRGTDESSLDSEQREFLRDFREYIEKVRQFPSTILWLLLQFIFIAVAVILMIIALHSPTIVKP